MGVIDVFTFYNVKKKFEHFGKAMWYEEKTVSCVPPQMYADRFVEWMQNAIQGDRHIKQFDGSDKE
jgi:1-phosphatidylinositol-4-phosphate 5-kinase